MKRDKTMCTALMQVLAEFKEVELMPDWADSYKYRGLCRVITHLERNDSITYYEARYIRNLIIHKLKQSKITYNSDGFMTIHSTASYIWKPGKQRSRILWLKKEIKRHSL